MTFTSHDDAALKRDTGMALAEDKANREKQDWSGDALFALEKYCVAHPDDKFLAEDVRAWGEALEFVSAPANSRAWGAVFRRAASIGIIRKVGYGPAASSNLSPKCLWKAA